MKTAIPFKKLLPWIILVVVIGGLAAWYLITNRVTTAENISYDAKIKEATTMYNSKEYSTAMSYYYEAADMIPSRKEAFQGILTILVEKSRVDDALSILEKSAKKINNQDQAILYTLVGNAYYENNNYDKALETFKKGQGVGVDNQDLELMIGKVYLKKGNIDNAAKQFQKDSYENDNLSEAKLLLSYIQSTSDVDSAKSTLGSVSSTEKWKAYYDEFASVLASLNTDTKFNATKLSRIFINNGYPTLAVAILQPLEAEMTEYLEGMYYLGRAYLETNDYDKALTELDKAVTLGGMEDSILWAKARAYMGKNDLNNAIINYAKAIGYQGKEPTTELIKEYMDILLTNNLTLKADELLQSLLKSSKMPYLFIYGIKINYVLNNVEKINYYISQLDVLTLGDVDKREYLYYKAKALLDQNGDITQINLVLNSLLDIDRYNPKYYFLLGRLQFEQGQANEAADSLKKAIEYDLSYEITEDATRLLSSVD
jgi:tetratricopeptide (TPR) repeat protein